MFRNLKTLFILHMLRKQFIRQCKYIAGSSSFNLTIVKNLHPFVCEATVEYFETRLILIVCAQCKVYTIIKVMGCILFTTSYNVISETPPTQYSNVLLLEWQSVLLEFTFPSVVYLNIIQFKHEKCVWHFQHFFDIYSW